MPDIEAASALLESQGLVTDSDSDDADVAAPPSDPVESESESVAAPTPPPAAERIDSIRARREERRQREEAKLTEGELKALREKAIAEAKEEWRTRLRSNPREALPEAGDPVEAYQILLEAAQNKESPEYKTAQAIREAHEEAKKAREEAAALRAQLEAQSRNSVVTQFLTAAESDEYLDLVVDFEEDELVAQGDRVANELAKEGKPFTIPDILNRLMQERSARLERAAARRAKRKPQSAAPATNPAATVQATREPTAIGNQLVSETASPSSGKLTKEQRMAIADEMVRAPRRRAG